MKKQALADADRKRILSKVDEMERYVSELSDMLPEEKGYLSDIIRRRACEKTVELAIEALVDSAALVVSSGRMGIPSSEENILDILEEKKAIGPALTDKLKNMKGFRNILVHRYGKINDKETYRFLKEDLGDFTEYRKAIMSYMNK